MKPFSVFMAFSASNFPEIALKTPEKCKFLHVFEHFCLKCALKVKVYESFCIKRALKVPHDCLISASEVQVFKMRLFLGQDSLSGSYWGTHDAK